MNDLYSLNVKVMAFDSEDPREQNCFVWTVSLSQGEQKRLLLAWLPGGCFSKEMASILNQITLVQAGFAVLQGRAYGVQPGYQCLSLTCHPISYNANPTYSVWQPQVLQLRLPSELSTSQETNWAWKCPHLPKLQHLGWSWSTRVLWFNMGKWEEETPTPQICKWQTRTFSVFF